MTQAFQPGLPGLGLRGWLKFWMLGDEIPQNLNFQFWTPAGSVGIDPCFQAWSIGFALVFSGFDKPLNGSGLGKQVLKIQMQIRVLRKDPVQRIQLIQLTTLLDVGQGPGHAILGFKLFKDGGSLQALAFATVIFGGVTQGFDARRP